MGKATNLRVKKRAAQAGQRGALGEAQVPAVNPFAAAHGAYVEGTVVDLSGELGGKRMSIVKVLINRGGTAVDRWIANDKAGLFEEPQRRAIEHCRQLWARAEDLRSINLGRDRVDYSAMEGWSQHEALETLAGYKRRIPRPFWETFENVVRFDQEAGVAGSSLASNSRSAIDAAKTTVAFCAGLIAMWERL
ncbi:MAG: hypothetical protein V4618_13425 [Pseudomonadota bacterium]